MVYRRVESNSRKNLLYDDDQEVVISARRVCIKTPILSPIMDSIIVRICGKRFHVRVKVLSCSISDMSKYQPNSESNRSYDEREIEDTHVEEKRIHNDYSYNFYVYCLCSL